ncbi:MAG: DUF6020 family protein [Brachybacterium sp.]|nr:DUF6020 family protein [Brachybacterium sp.]
MRLRRTGPDRYRHLGDRSAQFVGILACVVVVVVLSIFSTMGWLHRNVDVDTEWILFFDVARSHRRVTLGAFLCSVVVYTLLLGSLIAACTQSLRRASYDSPVRPSVLDRAIAASKWVQARWWRLALVVLVAWSPVFIMQFPGTSNADLIMQTREVLGTRAIFDYPPFDVYPTGTYLIPNDEVMLSNHHNAFLTLLYGSVLGASLDLYGNFEAGFIALVVTQVIFTLVAFGRAGQLLGRWTPHSIAAPLFIIAVIASGFPVAFWAMAIAKNPLFAAAFVWLLALAVDHVRSNGSPGSFRWFEWAAVTLIALNSAKFALPIIVVMIALVAMSRRDWTTVKLLLIGAVIPLIAFQMALRIGVDQDRIIPGDPLAGQGLQIQSMALTLRERPDALSGEDRQALDRIFDIEVMRENYIPATMAPVRGAGFRDGAYRWQEVTAEEAAQFDAIWLRLAQDEPDMITNGVLLTSFRFFDPLTQSRDNRPSIRSDDSISEISVDGENHLSDDFTNKEAREAIEAFALDVNSSEWLFYWGNSSTRIVMVILLATAAIALRRPGAWVWALPLALHCGVMLISPLDSSGRYALGITYFAPFAILALAGGKNTTSKKRFESLPPVPEGLGRRNG